MAKQKSSKKLTVSNNYNNEENNNIISTIVNILIIYYLINLEHNYCDCIRDWRHNYIESITVFSLIGITLLSYINFKSIIGIILFLLLIIYVYAFYTYIRDLDNTKCECAVVKQEKLHKFLNVWRYLMVIFPISVFLIGMFYMIYYMNKKNKNLVYNKTTKKYILKN